MSELAQHDYTGAEAVAEFWVDALNWAYATTDPSLLAAISLPACGTCARFIQRSHNAAARGKYDGGVIFP